MKFLVTLNKNQFKKVSFKDAVYGFTYIPEDLNFETVKAYHDYCINVLGCENSFLDNIVLK